MRIEPVKGRTGGVGVPETSWTEVAQNVIEWSQYIYDRLEL